MVLTIHWRFIGACLNGARNVSAVERTKNESARDCGSNAQYTTFFEIVSTSPTTKWSADKCLNHCSCGFLSRLLHCLIVRSGGTGYRYRWESRCWLAYARTCGNATCTTRVWCLRRNDHQRHSVI